MKTTTASLMAHLRRSGGRFLIGEHDGDLWASNSYWMVKATDPKGPFARLLGDYNLDLRPCACTAEGTLRRTGTEGPNPSAILDKARKAKKTTEIQPVMFGGASLLTRTSWRGRLGEVWGSATEPVGLDCEYLDLVTSLFPGAVLRATNDHLQPVALWQKDALVGVLMPIRLDGALTLAVDEQAA